MKSRRRIPQVLLTVVVVVLAAIQPTPASAATHCTGSGAILAYGDWECGTSGQDYRPWTQRHFDPAKPWAFMHSSASLPRQGTYAGRFEVRQGDNNGSSGERSEVALPGGIKFTKTAPFNDVYFAFSVRFDSAWPQCTNGFCIVAQWKGSAGDSGTPMISLRAPEGAAKSGTVQDSVHIFRKAGVCTDPLNCAEAEYHQLISGDAFRNNRGRWIDFIFHIKWSEGADGILGVSYRIDGQSGFTIAMADEAMPTLKTFPDANGNMVIPDVEARVGLYRSDENNPAYINILTHDSYCVATTFSAARSCLPA